MWHLCMDTFFLFYFLTFNFFLSFLGLHAQHMEVPRLGGANQTYSCWPTQQPQKCHIRTMSVTYTTAQGNTRSLSHWGRPGIEPETSWFLDSFPLHHNGNSSHSFLNLQIMLFLKFVKLSAFCQPWSHPPLLNIRYTVVVLPALQILFPSLKFNCGKEHI